MAEQKKDLWDVLKTSAKKIVKGVCDDLIEQEVFNKNEIKNMGKQLSSVKDKSEDLLKVVTHKSSQIGEIIAKRVLTSARQLQSGTQRADENLEPTENEGMSQAVTSLLSAPPAIQAAEYLNKVKLSPTEFYYELSEAKREEIYSVMEKGSRTRLALIICNTQFDHLNELNKAQFDIERMKELLQDLGYSVEVKKELSSVDMESVLKQFAARPEHQSSDSTFLVFMSYGTTAGICGIKHKQLEPDVLANDTIFRIFNNSNCSRLRHKPKIIVIQECQEGIISEQGAMAASAESYNQSSSNDPKGFEKDAARKEHVEKDFICFHSVTPNDISLEDNQESSLFVTLLTDCFQQYSWCCHVEDLFKKVQKSFATSQVPIQMPTIERQSMTRYFYLFPGI
ncbi:caspase-13-like isoform X2 [Gracilinanus agilis]|uniref:caspase-13-like isoform X2 n=1 Tax=Gracilinanus agilis TaxID=191870 RepID=UPI001CFC8CA0|nr:caspase-13-like isoform X2 [Gracilinanus agilis]